MSTNSVFNVNNVELGYELLRNVSTSSQKNSNINVFVGIINSDQLLEIPDDENVRRFIGPNDRLSGNVQKEIFESLESKRDNFSLLNGGITMVARSLKTHSDKNRMMLIQPSIINGSQTRGVARIYHQNPENPVVPIKVEIIVTTDDDLIAEISISRNYQTKVKDISIFGRRNAFVPLNDFLDSKNLPFRLVEDESERDGIQPALALQLAFLLMPQDYWNDFLPGLQYKKSNLYSSSNKWIKIYAENIFDIASKNNGSDKCEKAKRALKFVKSAVAFGLPLYKELQSQEIWQGIRVQNGFTRDSNGNISKVSNGWVFPLVSIHSRFMSIVDNVWEFNVPDNFNYSKATQYIKQFYDGDVNQLGKNSTLYSTADLVSDQFFD
ncbi:MAG: AIPR family protein [Jejuia sp.]